jgi:hypothetical protein
MIMAQLIHCIIFEHMRNAQGTKTKVANTEVVKAAKSLFSTLYRWLYPDSAKKKLDATVSTAWDTLPDTEKRFYISRVNVRIAISLLFSPFSFTARQERSFNRII